MKKPLMLLAVAALGWATSVKADTIALYTFTGSNLTAASVAPFVSASAVSLSAGTIEFGSSQATSWTNTSNSGVPYIEESGGWTSNSQSTAKNFRLTLSNDGANFTITNISYEVRVTPAGPSAIGFAINGTNVFSQNMTQDVTQLISLPITGNEDLASALITFQGWTNGSRSTAASGAYRLDTILIEGVVDTPADPPEVIITTADDTVAFATTSIDVEGTANANTVGDLIWTNALAGAGGVEPAAASWTVAAIPLAVGTNIIVVRGTNTAGASSQDSVTVIRQASPPPAVTVTTPVQSVVNAITSIDIQGTANADTVGELSWTNALTGAAGSIPVAASWTVPGVALSVGANAITVRGSNAFGTVVSSSVTITRDAPVLPVGTNVQVRQGFEVGDTWPILSGGGFASTEAGAAYTPASALIRTGTSSWQSVGSATNTLDLQAVSIAGKTDVVVSVRLASISVTGANGADVGDLVRVFVSLDGEAYTDAQTAIRGNSNARWGYNAVLVADRIVEATPPNTNVATSGTSTNNYGQIRLFIPPTATSVAVRVVAINTDPNEIWAIDDIELLSSDIETGGSGYSQEQEDWIVSNWGSIGAYPGDDVDSDLDGYLNVEEFVAGTLPTDNTSFFEVNNLTASGSPSVVITPSVTGRVYDVEATANLISGSWTVIATNVPGTGASLSIPDSAGATSQAYRVVVELAP